MSAARPILRPIAYVAGRRAQTQADAFLRAHDHTRVVQRRLLRQLLRRAEQTAFGRDHGFGKIRSYKDFVAAVPIRSYDQLRPYFNRLFRGETTALLPADDPLVMFSLTSGTTGEPKHIPVTRESLRHIRRGFNTFGILALNDHRDAWLRPLLQITSSMRESVSPTGVPCGAISGLIAHSQKRIVRWMYPVPPEVGTIADPVAKYYVIMRCGIGKDVALITTANPSSAIRLVETAQTHVEKLIRDVADGTTTPPGPVPRGVLQSLRFRRKRALATRLEAGLKQDGRLLPRHFWKLSFLAHWTGGTLRLYLKRLRALFGQVPIRDIGLVASEGRFSVPIRDNTAAGIAEITSNVLEFIPAESRGNDAPPVLQAHEVEEGKEYFLVVTNSSGLWRYDIDDRVRVVGRYGQSPVFEFLSRGLHTANLTGEKLTEHQVVEAMHQAAGRVGANVDCFLLQPVFAHTPYYRLQLEAPDDHRHDVLARALDLALTELNIEYRSKRKSGRLGPIRPVRLEPGTFQRAETAKIRRRHGRSEQYKHQYLLTDVIEET